VHAAALVALFRAASRLEDSLPAPLLGVFQPSEEAYPSGAEQLVAEGALADAAVVVAAHVHPEVPWGAVAVDAGPVNASSDNLLIVVEGRGGHAAYPHLARNPVTALAAIVAAVPGVVAARIDPMRSAVVTIGWIRAGSAENVIPAEVRAGGTLRALHADDREPLRQAVRELVEETARAYGCRARLELVEGEPAIVNDGTLVESVRPLVAQAGFGLAAQQRSCGSDDFGFFGAAARLLLLFVGVAGALPADVPLHHPAFLPPSEAVAAVARAQAAAYVAAARRI
jgi:amidohydrolase